MATDKKEIRPAQPAKRTLVKKDKAKPSHGQGRKPRKMSFKKASAFFRDVYLEMKKVTWPTSKEFFSYSAAVVVFVTILGVIIFAMDSAFAPLVALITVK